MIFEFVSGALRFVVVEVAGRRAACWVSISAIFKIEQEAIVVE